LDLFLVQNLDRDLDARLLVHGNCARGSAQHRRRHRASASPSSSTPPRQPTVYADPIAKKNFRTRTSSQPTHDSARQPIPQRLGFARCACENLCQAYAGFATRFWASKAAMKKKGKGGAARQGGERCLHSAPASPGMAASAFLMPHRVSCVAEQGVLTLDLAEGADSERLAHHIVVNRPHLESVVHFGKQIRPSSSRAALKPPRRRRLALLPPSSQIRACTCSPLLLRSGCDGGHDLTNGRSDSD
jgi:hypothetical protein